MLQNYIAQFYTAVLTPSADLQCYRKLKSYVYNKTSFSTGVPRPEA